MRGAGLTAPLVAVAWKRLSAPPSRPAGLATLTRVILPAALPLTETVPSAPMAIWSSVVPLGTVTGGLEQRAVLHGEAALRVDLEVAVAGQRALAAGA